MSAGNLIGSALTTLAGGLGAMLAFDSLEAWDGAPYTTVNTLLSTGAGMAILYGGKKLTDKVLGVHNSKTNNLVDLGVATSLTTIFTIGGYGLGYSVTEITESLENINNRHTEDVSFVSKEIGLGGALVGGTAAEYVGRKFREWK